MGGSITASLTEDVRLKTAIVFVPGSFYIDSMVGTVEPDIKIDPVNAEMTGVPDFLSDDSVKLDLTNPEIRLQVENPLGLPILLDLEMRGLKNGKQTHKKIVEIKGIEIPANQSPTPIIIILSRLGGTEGLDKEEVGNTVYYKKEELHDLFLKIPDEMKLDITAKAKPAEDHTISLGETEETVKIDYDINLPLSFGKILNIVYKDTINGWNEDVKNLDIKRIELETEILNTIPLELTLSGYAIDVNGKKLDRLTVGIKDKATIPPCKDDDSENSANIIIEIVEDISSDTSTAVMKELDGIVLNFTAKSTDEIHDKPLKSLQYLRLKGMKARIPGGVKINMNE
jgi:hypothetical protein